MSPYGTEVLSLFKKRDLFIFALIIVLTSLALFWGLDSKSGSLVSVRIRGEKRYVFDISDKGIKEINDGENHLLNLYFTGSDVRVQDSKCPLHLCERGSLMQAGVLVCVPQKVLVSIERDREPVKESGGIDLITG